MAEGREKPIKMASLAYRARDLLVTEDQGLEVIVAVRTMVLKYRHLDPPHKQSNLLGQNIRPIMAFFQSLQTL
jgi:hypothetical protein